MEEPAIQILTRRGPAKRRRQDRAVIANAVLARYERLGHRPSRAVLDAIRSNSDQIDLAAAGCVGTVGTVIP